jgi:hypothetical protein
MKRDSRDPTRPIRLVNDVTNVFACDVAPTTDDMNIPVRATTVIMHTGTKRNSMIAVVATNNHSASCHHLLHHHQHEDDP